VALRRCWLSDVGSLDRGRHQSLDLSPTTRKLVRIYLARTFTFDGMADQAGAALQRAGFPHYSMGENSGMDEYRSSGSFFTGADSGHFNVDKTTYMNDATSTPYVSGDMHFGEHNLFRGLGLGAIYHCLSDEAGPCGN
jgi:hypothetical protein